MCCNGNEINDITINLKLLLNINIKNVLYIFHKCLNLN